MKQDIYIFNGGDLKRKDNTLLFQSDGKNKYIPVENINSIFVFGEITINKSLLDFLAEKEILVNFYNYYGYYSGTYYPREHLNSGFVILKQAEYYLDNEKRVNLARNIIMTAIENMIVVLKYYNSRNIDMIDDINALMEFKNKMLQSKSIDELMGVEGNARERYYSTFNKIINNKHFEFKIRSKRPPKDKINALISFGNSIMYTVCLGEIYQTLLDPRIGYLHSTNSRRFSLNLDISEIFKPIIVDRTIFKLLNKNIITEKDFQKEFNGIMLNDEGRKKFLIELNDKLESVIKYDELDTSVSYRRLIRLELYKIQKFITEGTEYKGFIARW